MLIDKGASVNIKDNNGWSPLMRSMLNRNTKEHIKLLIDAGADLDIMSIEGQTALLLTNNPKMLIDAGADVNLKYQYGQTFLMLLLVRRNHSELIMPLLYKSTETLSKTVMTYLMNIT